MVSYGILSHALHAISGNPSPISPIPLKLDKYYTWAFSRIPHFSLPYIRPQQSSFLHPQQSSPVHFTGRHCALLEENCKLNSANPCNSTLVRASMDSEKEAETARPSQAEPHSMKVLFVEMGVGYDQHGQDITAAAMRACRDAICSNSIPAFRTGAVPGVNFDQMKVKIKLGVPHFTQDCLDIERVKSVFPYGNITSVEVVDGGLVCSSGVCLESMGDKNDDCYIVNAAVYVGY